MATEISNLSLSLNNNMCTSYLVIMSIKFYIIHNFLQQHLKLAIIGM